MSTFAFVMGYVTPFALDVRGTGRQAVRVARTVSSPAAGSRFSGAAAATGLLGRVLGILIGSVICLFALAPASGGTIRGRVFLDANSNGVADPGEHGVAGCGVSDERTIVRTGEDGGYAIELPAGPAAVFVVNAPGTVSAGRWWTSVADGAADASCDFPLRAEDQGGPLYFVHGTDLHSQTNAVPMIRRYVAHINALPVPVKFVVHTGDLVIDAAQASIDRARELFDLYEESCRPLRPPLRNIMGNHDIAGVLNPKLTGEEPDFGKALFRRRFGPASYALRHGRYHFIALDATTIKGRTLVYGLTKESADWAIAYLAGVGSDEPVVLLAHEPLFPEVGGVRQPDSPETHPHERRLEAALAGKTLLMTLAGHVHARSETSWAGAPHILGGAVSYAWHGMLPYPPTPRGYLLFRLEAGREEHVYLDWAEERSIDITAPAFTATVRGLLKVGGVVADPEGRVSAVECVLAGRTERAMVTRRGHLAQAFEATLDTAGLSDGVQDLIVTATDGVEKWVERHPVVVVNGAPCEFAAKGGARLTFRAGGDVPADTEVLCNGKLLVVSVQRGKDAVCVVPQENLRRLNEVVIRAGASTGGGKPPLVQSVTIEYDGQRYRDVRHAPQERRPLGAAGLVSWIDLGYADAAIVDSGARPGEK